MEKVRVSCYNRAVLFFYLLKDGGIYKKYLLKLIKEKIRREKNRCSEQMIMLR